MNLITKKLKLTKKTLFLYKKRNAVQSFATDTDGDYPYDPISSMVTTPAKTFIPAF